MSPHLVTLRRASGLRGKARITLVDANLTHIWKPLLHEVAAGSLNSSADELNYVAQAKWNHFEFQMGRMAGLDRASKCIRLEATRDRSEEHTSELQSLMPTSYAVFCLKKKKTH